MKDKNPRTTPVKAGARVFFVNRAGLPIEALSRHSPREKANRSIAFLVLVGLQVGMLGLIFRRNPSSSVRGTIFFLRFGTRFNRHDNEFFVRVKRIDKALNERAFSQKQRVNKR